MLKTMATGTVPVAIDVQDRLRGLRCLIDGMLTVDRACGIDSSNEETIEIVGEHLQSYIEKVSGRKLVSKEITITPWPENAPRCRARFDMRFDGQVFEDPEGHIVITSML